MKKTSLISIIILVIIVAIVLRIEIYKAYAPATPISIVQPQQPPVANPLPQVYINSAKHFSIRYPKGFTLDESYVYQELGPGKDIHGVKFTIPASLAAGTNLGSDSYISVEQIPNTKTCTASSFVDPGSSMKPSTVVDSGVTYSMTTSGDAGAGNRYTETVYAIPGTNPCTAIRYYIHYAAIENYPSGAVTEFNEKALIATFDQIRRTFAITPQ